MAENYIPSTIDWVAEQIAEYEASGGTRATTLRDTGIPIIVVTMRGQRSGAVRKIALMRVEHEGCYALVASRGGAPTHPEWYYNLLADPSVSIQDGATPQAFTVREVNGAERDLWWQRSVDVFATYDDYRVSAGEAGRTIPVLIAEPVA
ncbi:MAG: nitroreductase family deazaflavin-dependent oxidoreductase [Actinomycetota bacterium]|nr:nitroreductase family deazaflavin-dependent oxidoreductase [Actinomycetota bacterium]MDA3008068.1 nitroreductase family deazaflavin-dependent oxidoreductase [Actinomycetota bacterium]MDA3035443.1 nitroreductase family deazaflavin-dependent oxidoreductase [Actinomycetota bacterium]